MIRFEYTYDSLDEMAYQFEDDFRGPNNGIELYMSARDWLGNNDSVLFRLAPGDMTEYVIGLQMVRWHDTVGVSFFSPYHRAAIVPNGARGDYLLDKFKFTHQERIYPGLRIIIETVLEAVS